MNVRVLQVAGITLLGLLLINATFFTIKSTERGVQLRFGEVVNADLSPGLHVKVPLMHEVRKFDGRLQVSDSERSEFLTKESKRLIIDAYVVWRVKDVKKYFTNTGGDAAAAEIRLLPLVRDGLKNRVSERALHEVIAGQREQLMADLTVAADQIAQAQFGIQVVDVRVKRIEFPEKNLESIYARMKSEREREAREYRAKGNELAEKIRADADRDQRVLLAEAYREAEGARGQGDAQAAAIAARAFGKDPEFYRFYRSLQAYRASFSGKQDVLVLKPDSEFLRYLRSSGK